MKLLSLLATLSKKVDSWVTPREKVNIAANDYKYTKYKREFDEM